MPVGYKVVKESPNGAVYFPCIQNYGTHVVYKIGKWTLPDRNSGPLCCFSSEIDARKFIKVNFTLQNNSTGIRLFICEYISSGEICVYINCGRILPLDSLPTGTVLASEVKLLVDITNTPYI